MADYFTAEKPIGSGPYAHRDDHVETVGQAKIVHGKRREPNGLLGRSETYVEITFPRPMSREAALDTIHFSFDLDGGPSCGGAFSIRRLSKNGRRWSAVLIYGRNY